MEAREKKENLIFVVDDEPDILKLISINLQKSGYQVEEFTEGQPMLDRGLSSERCCARTSRPH